MLSQELERSLKPWALHSQLLFKCAPLGQGSVSAAPGSYRGALAVLGSVPNVLRGVGLGDQHPRSCCLQAKGLSLLHSLEGRALPRAPGWCFPAPQEQGSRVLAALGNPSAMSSRCPVLCACHPRDTVTLRDGGDSSHPRYAALGEWSCLRGCLQLITESQEGLG